MIILGLNIFQLKKKAINSLQLFLTKKYSVEITIQTKTEFMFLIIGIVIYRSTQITCVSIASEFLRK